MCVIGVLGRRVIGVLTLLQIWRQSCLPASYEAKRLLLITCPHHDMHTHTHTQANTHTYTHIHTHTHTHTYTHTCTKHSLCNAVMSLCSVRDGANSHPIPHRDRKSTRLH